MIATARVGDLIAGQVSALIARLRV
jgi:hypothetical protein